TINQENRHRKSLTGDQYIDILLTEKEGQIFNRLHALYCLKLPKGIKYRAYHL
ncbi:MAG: hypothetical protein ACI93V_001254, partial [Alteromonadaceae bacterium]